MCERPSETCSAFRVYSSSEGETRGIAALMARELSGGFTVLLTGGLGAGKTAFVRGFCEELGFTRVRSPSFTLVNRYEAGGREIVHSDLYRLEEGEVEDLDLAGEEAEGSILFVEWAERARFFSNRPLLEINIFAPDGINRPERRVFTFSAKNKEGELLLAPLRKLVEESFPP
ncbi:MAG: tRNA (adenosine(37)-N6)-threonylcarbamoyltransferase complex ATPase subunit type 1 TsaE [Aminivibrio sp.]|jgi:tRNA threonylcarbamoyladenosine biosynthesis protein TsaE|nr:tRNA (adenosine(37)-N6)-threonylcarbamoyltransferase complex ATPase subunit type 1 TsaE [Synergistaceae bacterium]